jgi:hypothetical protein
MQMATLLSTEAFIDVAMRGEGRAISGGKNVSQCRGLLHFAEASETKMSSCKNLPLIYRYRKSMKASVDTRTTICIVDQGKFIHIDPLWIFVVPEITHPCRSMWPTLRMCHKRGEGSCRVTCTIHRRRVLLLTTWNTFTSFIVKNPFSYWYRSLPPSRSTHVVQGTLVFTKVGQLTHVNYKSMNLPCWWFKSLGISLIYLSVQNVSNMIMPWHVWWFKSRHYPPSQHNSLSPRESLYTYLIKQPDRRYESKTLVLFSSFLPLYSYKYIVTTAACYVHIIFQHQHVFVRSSLHKKNPVSFALSSSEVG